ncbi:hypothetical protein ACFXG4_24235 [Nocardia sp. NPDC059246]|uniref:ATP-dependent DNA ligase n=1 Tax=unclassified Nocardia TaxID=2637762 RepID=UPI0036752DEA
MQNRFDGRGLPWTHRHRPCWSTGVSQENGPAPADDDTRYAYEWKYDGIRCLAWISNSACHMVGRNGNSLSAAFPEISHALLSLAAGREMTLDGELVAPDRDGVPPWLPPGRRVRH